MMDEYLIALDIDWASDILISQAANLLIEHNVKATWFVTHDSPEISNLSTNSTLFELGIHPNFDSGSTQGSNQEEIMSYLKKIVPDAKSVRTHNLLTSTPMLKMMCMKFGILYETSLLLPEMANIVPIEWYFNINEKMMRVPCFWGDHQEITRPAPSFSIEDDKYHVPGVKIFSFHPIHIVLNSNNIENYNEFKLKVDIKECSQSDIDNFKNKTEPGTGSFFNELLKYLQNSKKAPGLTITELISKWESLKV